VNTHDLTTLHWDYQMFRTNHIVFFDPVSGRFVREVDGIEEFIE